MSPVVTSSPLHLLTAYCPGASTSLTRARQTVTISDKKFFIMGSKRSHLFEHLVFRMSAFGTEAHRCIEMQCRMPGKPLFVYRLTDISADGDKLISARQVITDATGIKRWEN